MQCGWGSGLELDGDAYIAHLVNGIKNTKLYTLKG